MMGNRARQKDGAPCNQSLHREQGTGDEWWGGGGWWIRLPVAESPGALCFLNERFGVKREVPDLPETESEEWRWGV